jgi:hypothetical protein
MLDKRVITKVTLSQPRNVFRCLLRLKMLKNFTKLSIEGLFKLKTLKGIPYYLTIESGNICNLRCTLCPTGQYREG